MIDRLPPDEQFKQLQDLSDRVRGNMRKLTIWCEGGKCRVAEVYEVRGDHLVDVRRGPLLGHDEHGPLRIRRWQYWLEEVTEEDMSLPAFSVTCRCQAAERHWVMPQTLIAQALLSGQQNLGVPRGSFFR